MVSEVEVEGSKTLVSHSFLCYQWQPVLPSHSKNHMLWNYASYSSLEKMSLEVLAQNWKKLKTLYGST
jgi:hypothetical protein